MLAGNGEDSRDAILSMAKNLSLGSLITSPFLDEWRGVASRDNAPETENQIPILIRTQNDIPPYSFTNA